MPDVSDVISYSDAAREKECSRTTLYRAVEDGRLSDVDVGDRRMLVKDEDYAKFAPELVGRRAQKFSDDNPNDSS